MSRMVVFALLTFLLWQEVVCRSASKSSKTKLPKTTSLEIFMEALPHFRRVRDTGVVPEKSIMSCLEEQGEEWVSKLPLLVLEKVSELLETEHCVERLLCETSLGKGLFSSYTNVWIAWIADFMGIFTVFPERYWDAVLDVGYMELDAPCEEFVCSIIF